MSLGTLCFFSSVTLNKDLQTITSNSILQHRKISFQSNFPILNKILTLSIGSEALIRLVMFYISGGHLPVQEEGEEP